MTGKEALEKIKNNQHYREEKNWIIATSLQNTEEYKAINKELEELTKYKRAFEILKDILSVHKDTSLNGKVDFYTLYFEGELPYECYKRLTKEEYELLEELMKDE